MAAFIPLIVSIAFKTLEYFANKRGTNENSRRIFRELAEDLRKLGIASVKSRYEAEAQIGEIEKEWEKRHDKTKV